MSSDYGKQTIFQGGREIRTLADGKASWKAGGITIDWSTVPANSVNTTLPDGTIVPAGTKYIRYGTVMSRITASNKFGPADTTAADGRQLVTNAQRGNSFVLDRTITEAEYASNTVGDVYDGGNAFEARLLIGGTNQPTRQNFVDMFPKVTLTKD
ncbi:MAG: hypothetical protein JST12_14690 [Armatimonadetes bacterium]|nr:hypothetical protein [Armatimonadota bacterium]